MAEDERQRRRKPAAAGGHGGSHAARRAPARKPAARQGAATSAPAPLRPEDALAFMQQMWNPFGVALPGFAPSAPESGPTGGSGAAGPHAPSPAAGPPPPNTSRPPGGGAPGSGSAGGDAWGSGMSGSGMSGSGTSRPGDGPLGGYAAGLGGVGNPALGGVAPGGAPFAPFGVPMPFPHPAAMFAALDPAEVERKIAELRIIEGWLRMTLGMTEMSIKTLELQKVSLEALRGAAYGREGDGGG